MAGGAAKAQVLDARTRFSIQPQPSSDRPIARDVCPFGRRFELSQAGRQQLLSLRCNEFRHVDHVEQFAPAERFQHRSPQAELDRSPQERLAVGIVIGIPLQAHVGGLDVPLPIFPRRVARRIEGRRNSLAQQPIEERPPDAQPEAPDAE